MPIRVTASGHILHAVRGLLRLGWRFDRVPDNAELTRNGQLVRLQWGKHERTLRMFIYKITGSGRNIHERRIEITTTYPKGLAREPGYEDIVFGYEPEQEIFVGIDARRIEHGGKTGNASSFINPEGLRKANSEKLTILRRPSHIFGVEHQAYFKSERIAEYLLNAVDIHRGIYDRYGEFSRNRSVSNSISLNIPLNRCGGAELVMAGPASERRKQTIRKQVLAAFEEENAVKLKNLRLTQDQLFNLTRIRQEIGLRGEEFILKSERKRLSRAGKDKLAARISWVSQTRPFEGYDILSYETNGRKRYIEVKTSVGSTKIFPITDNEWRVAGVMRARYFIYRVTTIDTKPSTRVFQDPIEQEKLGILKRCPLAWTIEYQ
jgi:hypothetical protein